MDTTGTFEMATALAGFGALTAVHKHYTPEDWCGYIAAHSSSLPSASAGARCGAGASQGYAASREPSSLPSLPVPASAASDGRVRPAECGDAGAGASSKYLLSVEDGVPPCDGVADGAGPLPSAKGESTQRGGAYAYPTSGCPTPRPPKPSSSAGGSGGDGAGGAVDTLSLCPLDAVAVSAGTSSADWHRVAAILNHDYTAGIAADQRGRCAVGSCPVSLLCLDVANGYSEGFVDCVRRYREAYPRLGILAGNVVTGEMTEELVLSGADIIKVGIGPGSVCTTRKKTGVGYPQLSAVIECADAAHGLGALVVSDGGCVNSGDVAKALGAGADLVMLGGMLAGHDESGGAVVERVCLVSQSAANVPQPLSGVSAVTQSGAGAQGQSGVTSAECACGGETENGKGRRASVSVRGDRVDKDAHKLSREGKLSRGDDDNNADNEAEDEDEEDGDGAPESDKKSCTTCGGGGQNKKGKLVSDGPAFAEPTSSGSSGSSGSSSLASGGGLTVVKKFKEFYGMSSALAMTRHHGGVANYRASEGKAILCPYRGPVAGTVQDILGGIRSACTYVGAAQVKDLSKRTTFIRVTQQTNDIFGVERD